MGNVIIIHGCSSLAEEQTQPLQASERHWISWLKDQLVAQGIPTTAPQMPESWQPNYEHYDESIKSRVNEIIYFTADDEEKDGKESLKMFHVVLGGEIIELSGRGHYVYDDMGTEEFPELLAKIINEGV